VKRGEYYISKIQIMSGDTITAIDVEYTNRLTGDKTKSNHCSKGFKRGSVKNSSLQLNSDDFINYVKITHHSSLTSIIFKTNSNKSIQVGNAREYDKIVE
jgi:hypothetical protein